MDCSIGYGGLTGTDSISRGDAEVASDPASLDVRVETAAEALHAIVPEWESLLSRSGTNEPTLTPSWVLAWWRVFGHLDGRKLRVVVMRRAGRLVGLAPLVARRHAYRPGIPFRRLELIGSGEDEEDEICSDYLSIIAERGAEEQVATAFAGLLAFGGDAIGFRWDEIVIPAMDGEKPMTEKLQAAFAKAGLRAELAEVARSPYIPLGASWDAYLGSLSSSHRYVITRSLRDFERWSGGGAELHEAKDEASLAEGKWVLARLHEERWRSELGRGVFSSARFVAFHDAVMADLLAKGALDLLWLSVAGEPIAAIYNIVHGGKVYFYQCGRNVEVPKGIRPGVVMQAYAIRRAISRGLREYDFLPGASQYKMQLATATRPLVELRAVRPSLRETARALVAAGSERARSWAAAFRARGPAAPASPQPNA